MAFAIGAGAAQLALSMELFSTTGDSATKRTMLDGAISDATLLEIAEDIDNLTNAHMVNPKFGGRVITGQKGAAVDALERLISIYLVLTFTKTDAISGALISKNFIIPAPVAAALTGTPLHLNVGTPGTGSLAARAGRLVANLEDNLAYLEVDKTTFDNGGWTFQSSGVGTADDVVDGE
jgi:hypothetical protein